MFDQGVSDQAPLEQSLNCHSTTRVQQVCHSKSLVVTSGMIITWKMKLTPASPKSACKYHYGFCKATIGWLSLNTEGRVLSKGSTLSLLLFRICLSSSSGQVSSPSCCCLLLRNTGDGRAAGWTVADVASLQKRSGTRNNLDNMQAWCRWLFGLLLKIVLTSVLHSRLQTHRQSKLSAKAVSQTFC